MILPETAHPAGPVIVLIPAPRDVAFRDPAFPPELYEAQPGEFLDVVVDALPGFPQLPGQLGLGETGFLLQERHYQSVDFPG